MELPTVLEVTQEDIDKARAARCGEDYNPNCECLVAHTLQRVTGAPWNVGISVANKKGTRPGTLWLSHDVQVFIMTYCLHDVCVPTTFTDWYTVAKLELIPA